MLKLRGTRSRSLYVAAPAALLITAVFAKPAAAYIDPGTYQAVWGSLAPLLGILVACVAVLLLPLRFLIARVRSLWTRPKGKKVLAAAAAVVILAGVVAGIVLIFGGKHEAGSSAWEMKAGRYKRVLVLGMDGLDPVILDRMMEAGDLPNFTKLRREGSYARLQTSVPPESPVAWTCAATGANPGRHGIYDFIQPRPGTYIPDNSTPRHQESALARISGQPFVPAVTIKTFWDIASDHGKQVSVIRWPATFPAQPVNGHLLTGLGTPTVAGTMSGIHGFKFFTTTAKTTEGWGRTIVRVTWGGNAISTYLDGPMVNTITGRGISNVPLRIERDGSNCVIIHLGENDPFKLQVGEWSAWHSVQFPGGMSSACPAIVKLFLLSASPNFGLYVTPLHIDPAKPAYPISFPADYSKDLAKEIGSYATLGLPEDPASVAAGVLPLSAFLELCNDLTSEREAIFERELKQFKSGVLAVVFDTSDRIQHMFWAATDPKHPAYTQELAREFGRVIEDHYKRMDVVLGRAMQEAHGDMAILVMSDHGFTSLRRFVSLDRWLVQKGYLVPKDPNAPAGELLGNVDWSKTRAFGMGYCGVYLNVRGREPEGCVAPDEQRRVRDEIAQALRDWRDPDTGAQVV